MDVEAFYLENNCWKLFVMESAREHWVNQIYSPGDVNDKFMYFMIY
jgi:hypothetical protein